MVADAARETSAMAVPVPLKRPLPLGHISGFQPKKGAKPAKRRNLSSLKAECDKLAHAWLTWGKDATKRHMDHSLTDVVEWWKDNEARNTVIAYLASR